MYYICSQLHRWSVNDSIRYSNEQKSSFANEVCGQTVVRFLRVFYEFTTYVSKPSPCQEEPHLHAHIKWFKLQQRLIQDQSNDHDIFKNSIAYLNRHIGSREEFGKLKWWNCSNTIAKSHIHARSSIVQTQQYYRPMTKYVQWSMDTLTTHGG